MTIALNRQLPHPNSAGHPIARAAAPDPTTPRTPNPTPAELWRLGHSNLTWRARFLWLWWRRAVGIIPPRRFSTAHLAQGLTIVLPGIEAESVFTYGMCDGLLAGNVQGAIRVFNWGMPFPGGYLGNLCHYARNRRRARDLAAQIVAYQDEYPGRPVNVVAHSGGAGIAVFAAEALPPERSIHALVLLNGALSPTYDLSPALARTQRGILNSYSSRDWLVLDWGTRFFGTTDRKFVRACGSVGFSPPAQANPTLYEKLHQFSWTPEMSHSAHLGGHVTSCTEAFLEHYIAPWLRAGRNNAD